MITRSLYSVRLAPLVAFLLLTAGGLGAGGAIGQETAPIFSDEATCFEATAYCQQLVPYYMINDYPDSLLAALNFWESNCGSAEPIRRVRILASIWDGNFTESLYDTRLIDDLIWRYDPGRIKAQTVGEYPELGEGNVASVVDYYAEAAEFDAFTTDLADQLLPHATAGSVEEFFCLFYGGKTDLAYAMLEGDTLQGTELYRRYNLELSSLERPVERDFGGITGGFWRPMGGLVPVGNHGSFGVFAGRRWPYAVVRSDLSMLLGRADEPYWVKTPDYMGLSDRYGCVSLLVEGGPTLLRRGRMRLDLILGGGFEVLQPFKDEDDILLTTFKWFTGVGTQVDFGPNRSWFLGLDWRREWISDPSEEGTDLGGDAWNIRLSLGFYLKSVDEKRLTALGR